LNFASTQGGGADIAFFLLDLDGGGAERAIVALAGDIAKRGHSVELVVGDAASDYRSEVSAEVNIVDFATRSPLLVFRRLTAYLRRRNPTVVMTALDLSNIMLVLAARLGGYKGRTVISQRAVIAASLRELTAGRRMLTAFLQRMCFPRADALISNSHAAASEVRTHWSIPAEKVTTIHNALDADRINRLAREPLGDRPFLKDGTQLIVSVGSLTRRKDMATLIKAFARVKAKRQAHLVIIGKGAEEARLERLICDLGLSASVSLPGFDSNPYKWMSAAAVFVSSSTEEGFPNVVAEALALGRSVVATDCPGDTARLLGHGKWGRLVPVGDPERMADAILRALDDPDPPDGRVRAADFAPAKITSAYLDVLLPVHRNDIRIPEPKTT
jgi:glycosyltransferase involved in cell wall biosynthesis